MLVWLMCVAVRVCVRGRIDICVGCSAAEYVCTYVEKSVGNQISDFIPQMSSSLFLRKNLLLTLGGLASNLFSLSPVYTISLSSASFKLNLNWILLYYSLLSISSLLPRFIQLFAWNHHIHEKLAKDPLEFHHTVLW